MYKQDDSRADNDSLCGFAYANFRAGLHQNGSKRKFAVVGIYKRLVCKSYTDSDSVKLEK